MSAPSGAGRMVRLGKPPLTRTLAIGCVLVLVVTAAVWWLFFGADRRRITVYFSSAVSVYEGGDVRVLGVPVGSIEQVRPQPERVRVVMSVRRDVEIPADAGAVVVSPSIVSGRYVQLAPVYEGGPTMDDGAVIPLERTATPVEIDQIYSSINTLTTALGPKGANKKGALSELLRTGAATLEGNGKLISETLANLGKAGTTLSGSSEDLFATVDNLRKFTSVLASNDEQVRRFNTQMKQVNSLLAGQRDDLGQALAELALALGKVETFVRDNRAKLHSNVEQLNSVAQVLVDQEKALTETLNTLPLTLGNLQNAYNAASGTLDVRANLNELNQPPAVAVCKLVRKVAPDELPPTVADTCRSLAGVAEGALPTPAETVDALNRGELPPLPLQVSKTLGTPTRGGDR